MQTIDRLNQCHTKSLLNWCKSQKLVAETFRKVPTCRLKKWWGYEAEFYIDRSYVTPRQPIESDPYLQEIAQQFAPESNSILLYRYEVGGEIGKHLDKKCFEPEVTMINLIDDKPDIYGGFGTTKFIWNGEKFFLENGGVYRFNSRVWHSVPTLKVARYSLQFRRVIT